MPENNTKYSIALPDGTRATLDQEQYDSIKDNMFGQYPDAQVTRMSVYDPADDDASASDIFHVSLSDGTRAMLNRQQFDEAKDGMFAQFPDAEVLMESNMTDRYWRPKAEDARRRLQELGSQNDDFMRQYENNGKLANALDQDGIADNQYRDFVDANREKYNSLVQQREALRSEYFNNPIVKEGATQAALLATELRDNYRQYAGQAPSGSERRDWNRAAKIQDDIRKIYEAPNKYVKDLDDGNGFSRFLDDYASGAVDKFTDKDFYTAGLSAIARNFDLRGIAEKIQAAGSEQDIDNVLTPGEKAQIVSFYQYADAQRERADSISKGYSAGGTFAESLKFMAEFLLSTGAANVAGKALSGSSNALASWLGRQLMTEGALKALGQGAVQGGKAAVFAEEFLARPIIQGLWHTATQLSSLENIADGLLDTDSNGKLISVGKAISKGLTDSVVENWSESFGGAIEKTMALPFKGLGWVGEHTIGNQPFGRWARWLYNSAPTQILKEAGFNGMLGEIGEEWVGNAVRVGLGLMSKEEFKDFASWEQQLEMAASFAPLTLTGLGSASAAAIRKSGRYEKLSGEVRDILQRQGRSQEEIDNLFNTRFDTPEDVGRKLAPYLREISLKSQSGGATKQDEEDYKTITRFAEELGIQAVVEEMDNIAQGERRDKMRSDMEATVGRFWQVEQAPEGEEPRQSVRVVKDNDGNSFYVIGVDEGGMLAAVTEDGKPHFVEPTEMAEDNTYTMDEFLQGRVDALDADEEARRMNDERVMQIESIKQAIAADPVVPMGTIEAPKNAAVVATNNAGAYVTTGEGEPQFLSWSDIGAYLGTPVVVKTNAQMEQDVAAELDAARGRIENYKNIVKGTEFTAVYRVDDVEESETLQFERAVLEDGQVMIYARNEQGETVQVTEDMVEDLPGLVQRSLQTAGNPFRPGQIVTFTEDSGAIRRGVVMGEDTGGGFTSLTLEDGTPATVRTDRLQMEMEESTIEEDPVEKYINDQGKVNQTAFMNQEPEEWARWNDEKRQDGGADTRERITASIAALDKEIGALTKQKTSTPNPDEAETMGDQIKELSKRRNRLATILQSYQEPQQAEAKPKGKKREEAIPGEVRQSGELAPEYQVNGQAPVQQLTPEQAEEQRRVPLRERALGWAERTGVGVELLETPEDVQDETASKSIAEGKRVTGWYDPNTGKVYIYVPNIKDEAEIDKTYIHEVISHKGLKEMLGAAYNSLLDHVWGDLMSESDKKRFTDYVKATSPNAEGTSLQRAAADEYIADLSERIGLENVTEEELSNWRQIVMMVRQFFMNMFTGMKVTEEDLSDLLVASMARYKAIKEQGRAEALMRRKEAVENGVVSIEDAAAIDDQAIRFNIRTEESVQEKIREFANSEEGKKLGWTQEQVEGIISETADLMKAINAAVSGDKYYDEWKEKNPTTKVDWRDGVEKPVVTWSRANIEYKYDMSADLLCINNEGLETVLSHPTMVDLMLKMNESTKEGFTSDDYLRLYETLRDLGFVVPCKGCFDAAMRLKMLPSVSRKFVDLVNKTIDERNKDPQAFDDALRASAGEDATIEGFPTSSKNKDQAVRVGVAGDNLTEHISWAQLMSAEGQTKALSDWGGIFRAWQRTGAGRPKDKLLPEPWSGEIVSTTTTIIGKYGEKTPSYRDVQVNMGTGLRRNSHSEFRPILAIDEIQFMREAYLRNLTVFKYMKELDDVRLFGKLGVKFNMSFFPAFVEGCTAAGLDVNGDYIAAEESVGGREFEYTGEDGKTHYDGMKGWQEAQKYVNKDVSLSTVVFSIPHLIKALTDVPTRSKPRGLWGSLIPFHASGSTSNSLEKQGLGKARAIGGAHGFDEALSDWDKGVTNFEAVQNDRFGEGWEVVDGKRAGTAVEPGHKLEFANGTHYYNKSLGLHLFSSFYIYDSEIKKSMLDKKGNLLASKAKAAGHPFVVDYNDKVREIGTDTAYQDAADYYIQTLRDLGLIPRFDFEVDEETYLKACEAAKVDPNDPALGWRGPGNSWSPADSEAYYSLWCDYGMIDPETGKLAPHNPVGIIDEQGNRTFEMPENTVDIIKAGVARYSERKSREEARVDEAIDEFANRSVSAGKISREDADAILAEESAEEETPTPEPQLSQKTVDALRSVGIDIPETAPAAENGAFPDFRRGTKKERKAKQEAVAEAIKAELASRGFDHVMINKSDTKSGVSTYVNVYRNSNLTDLAKIRISDHGVTNNQRATSEYHVSPGQTAAEVADDLFGNNSGTMFRITPEQDQEYLDAVNSNDMEKAQEMVDNAAEAAGYTIRGYHGTTHNFTIFDRSKGNAEGNWGKGFYFTNNEDDADANYANEDGPDLTARIEHLAEQMEWMDGYEDMDYDQRLEAARKELAGENPHTISAAIRMDNPLIINSRAVGPKETFFDFDSGYNPETDEYEGEESGLLLDFINAWEDVRADWDWLYGDQNSPAGILDYADGDGLTASQLEEKAREILAYVEDENGDIATGEFLRQVFERMGFDGIVDHNVNIKFGTQRKFGRSMDGMDTGTVHMIAFQPNQIKQTDPVTLDNEGNVIPLSERFNEGSNDIRFKIAEENLARIDDAIANSAPPMDQAAAEEVVSAMEADAERNPGITFSEEEWNKQFPNDRVETPIGEIKLGENQKTKLDVKNRRSQFGMMKPTLENPDLILYKEDQNPPEDAERAGKLLFVKTFVSQDGKKHINFESVTVRRENLEISISSHIADRSAIVGELQEDNLVYMREALLPDSSEWYLAEQNESVPDLVPTQESNASSEGKGSENSEIYNTLFRVVEDPAKIDELEQDMSPKPAYRAAQFVPDPNGDWEFDLGDGNGLQKGFLYPPMSAQTEKGVWRNPILRDQWEQSEEAPEKAILKKGKKGDKWVFRLHKGNGKYVDAAYNPYFHSSETMLNDQFAEAQSRPNLVVLEVMLPQSQIDENNPNPYHAEKAKDHVGKHDWKAGPIQQQLTGTRKVNLTQYDKPVRIVPVDEVAANVEEMIRGQVKEMPTNVVTPQLRAELEKLGVPFVETSNQGVILEGEHKGENYQTLYKKAPKKLTEAQEKALDYIFGESQEKARDLSAVDQDFAEQGISIDNPEILEGYGLKNVTLSRRGDYVGLTHFIVEDQNKGNGTRFMQDLAGWADENGYTLTLTPDTSFGATSVNRLKDFYKRFGFKENKGRYIDYETNDSMIRKPSNGDEIRFSIRGVIGASEDEVAMDNYEVAQAMEQEGKDPVTIWRATGWEKGVDGKWRNEIPDAKQKADADLRKSKTVGDVLEAPELFGSYPQLADINVELGDYGYAGAYNRQANRIRIDKDSQTYVTNPEDKRLHLSPEGLRTMLHELQHAIQAIEGFARGGTEKQMEREYYLETGKTDPALMTMAWYSLRRNTASHLISVGRDRMIRAAENFVPTNETEKQHIDGLIERLKGMDESEYASFVRKARRLVTNAKKAGETGYKNLAGEVEARNVETRSKLTQEGREKNPPSVTERVSRKDQIVRFRMANENQKTFISNAEKAVEELKMDKATPEQWKKTLEKNGGLKAAEDKWLGLSTWLDGLDRKTVTKQEVLDYIAENQIQIEEQRYSEEAEKSYADAIASYQKEFAELVTQGEQNGENNPYEYAYGEMGERYGDDFEYAFQRDGDTISPIDSWNGDGYSDEADYFLDQRREETDIKDINMTRLGYTTEGLTNKAEIALTVPTIEPWNEADKIHFGDAGEGRAIAWARFGDTFVDEEIVVKPEDKAELERLNKKVHDAFVKAGQEASDENRDAFLAARHERDLFAGRTNARGGTMRKKVLVIDEIQSKRHQEAREQGGYKDDRLLSEAAKRRDAAKKEYDKYTASLLEKYGGFNGLSGNLTPEENAESQRLYYAFRDAENAVTRNGFDPMMDEEYRRLREEQRAHEHGEEFQQLLTDWKNAEGPDARQAINEQLKPFQARNRELLEAMEERERVLAEEFNDEHKSQVPAAPFEKNWHELAMKRMLRLAAEEGYDYVAWTTGEQQAERYNLGGVLRDMEVVKYTNGGWRLLFEFKNGYTDDAFFNEEGIVNGGGQFQGKHMSEVVGKELAERIMNKEAPRKGTFSDPHTADLYDINGDGLRIGGEGMKGFYDDILPRWMNKYGKKWGVKVEDMFLPGIGEGDGLTMHSVPVTQEMKESVMQGQTMFRITGLEDNYDGKWKDGDYTYVGPKVQDGTPEAAMLDYIMATLNGKYHHGEKPWEAIGYVHNYISDNPQEVPTWTEEAANKFQPEMFLTKEQLETEKTIRSDNFMEWFGDWEKNPEKASKVVDEGGKPLVVYHGTRQGRFTEFKETDHGIFFTGDPGVADDYAYYDNDYGEEDEDAMVVGAYLDIKKPFIIDADYYDWKSLPMSYKGLNSGSRTTDGWARYLMEQHPEYDGLIVENVEDGYGRDDITTVYAVFKPNQIKSADPVTYDDQGNVIPLSKRFDSENNDIRFRTGEQRRTADELIPRVQNYGFRGVMEKEDVDGLYSYALQLIPEEQRREIIDNALGDDLDIRKKTQGYIANLASRGFEGDESGLLRVLVDRLSGILDTDASDNELLYMLWRGTKRYSRLDALALAQDVTLRRRWNVGEYGGEKYPGKVTESMAEAAQRIEAANEERSAARGTIRREGGDNLAVLNRAMSAQRKYDQETVNAVVALAKDLIKKGNVSKVSAREMARLMTIIKDANGRRPATVKASTKRLLDFLVDHTIATEKELLDKMVKVRTAKVKEPGVDIQAKLDIRAQGIVNAFRDNYSSSEADIRDEIARLEERFEDGRLSENTKEEIRTQIEGLNLALQYATNITQLENDIRQTREQVRDSKAEYDGLSQEEKRRYAAALKEEKETSEEVVREKKIEMVDAFRDIRAELAKVLNEGEERGLAFIEAEKKRVDDIHHAANADLQGVDDSVEAPEIKGLPKLMNWPVARGITAPMANFDQLLRTLGRKSTDGKGYLWSRFMPQLGAARDNEKLGLDAADKELTEKVREIFDDPNMDWNDLYGKERGLGKTTFRYMNANGRWVEGELTPGNLLYVYMVNKMNDGKMKLRQMNITEEDVARIKESLPAEFIELADWIQDEFLPKLRDKYNTVHQRLFGTSMASIENYFPLRILGGVIREEVDLSNPESSALPSAMTGAIIKRTVNTKQLDVQGTDAFSLVIEHIREMEHWAAYAEVNRDLGTLLSYNRFKNQVKHLKTVFGAGPELWSLLRKTAVLAAGEYRPVHTAIDKAVVNAAKGVTAAKIAFRAYTAIKQVLSWPAFIADTNPVELAKATNPLHWKKNWDWAMENLPAFKKRVESRKAGIEILEDTDLDNKIWNNAVVKWINSHGMAMNAFVDALTVSIGSKAMYETKYKQYISEGFSEEEADKKAKFDAVTLFNETQQSSEKEFLSVMQSDRTVASVALTVYRNSSMGYQRQLHQGLRTLARMGRKGYREESIEFTTKQLVREGLTEEQAREAAEKRYNRAGYQAAARVATFGFIVQFAWNLGSHAVYLLFGDDDDEKKDMLWEDATHALLGGWVEGLAAGNLASEFMNIIKNGDWRSLTNWDPSTLPILSDLKNTISHLSSDAVVGMNDLVYLGVQIGLGTNPQTFSDAIVAIMDACNGDFETSKEAMFCIMRILAVPQSQLDQLMIDEIGMSARDASKLSFEDVAKRYAEYKITRDAPVTGFMYTDKERKDKIKSKKTTFKKKVNERKK